MKYLMTVLALMLVIGTTDAMARQTGKKSCYCPAGTCAMNGKQQAMFCNNCSAKYCPAFNKGGQNNKK